MNGQEKGWRGFCALCGTYQPIVVRQEYRDFPPEHEERYVVVSHLHNGTQCLGSERMPEFVVTTGV